MLATPYTSRRGTREHVERACSAKPIGRKRVSIGIMRTKRPMPIGKALPNEPNLMRYLLLAIVLACPAAVRSAEPIGEFSLPDSHGKMHHLADYADSKLIVVAVLGTECPLAMLYGSRLAGLDDEYAPK